MTYRQKGAWADVLTDEGKDERTDLRNCRLIERQADRQAARQIDTGIHTDRLIG